MSTTGKDSSDLNCLGRDFVTDFQRDLLLFYDARRRDLPWRDEGTPYRVWISEVMLQQTRVETVTPYYQRWVQRFPDVHTLASADLETVLQHWKGLGYYSRARNLHRAAGVVRERYHGVLPKTVDELRELPGIGRYTAGAIASIAFGEVTPVVDGNVRRVLARVFDLSDPPEALLWNLADQLVAADRPGDFNQGLMELGATVCTPRSPGCSSCPLSPRCRALQEGTVLERPLKKRKAPVRNVRIRTYVFLLTENQGPQVFLTRRPEDGLLGGLWEFPGLEAEDSALEEPGLSELSDRFGFQARDHEPTEMEPVRHIFTHIDALYVPVLVEVESVPESPDGRWVRLDALDELPLSVAQQKIGRSVMNHLASGD